MASIFEGLTSLFKGREPAEPEGLDPKFEVEVPDEEEAAADQSEPYVDVDLAGEVFGIQYHTPKGAFSRKWITVEGFRKKADGTWDLYAYCFARKRVLSLPLETIEKIYNADGDPLTLNEIFPEAGADAPKLTDTSGHAAIDACRDGLRALSAMAKIDGTFHDKERETIMDYAANASKKAGITMSDADKKAVDRYIRHLQPTGDLVVGCLNRLAEADGATQKEFFWAAKEVMDADGTQDEAEAKLLLQISEALSKEV